MKPASIQNVPWLAGITPLDPDSGFSATRVTDCKCFCKVGLALALSFLALAGTRIEAQQPYGYGTYAGGYSGQYAPPPPNSYAQPQYRQPQYTPQYNQPQYPQPQYAQPEYAPPADNPPQYAQPGYAEPGYAQPPEGQQQPYADPGQPYAPPDQPGPPDLAEQPDLSGQPAAPVQPLSAGELEQLLAPIALYPDNLLAQILAASTYPAQVAAADQWLHGMQSQGYGSPDQVAAGAEAHGDWDPSIKGLTAFPQVLDTLNQNLAWTTALGNAYYNQPQDVMQTVQVLRDRAQQAGNLQNTPQEEVSNDQGYLEVAPENPEMVYVPAYNPWDVYGEPIAPYPGFSVLGTLGSIFGASPIQFGLGVALSAFERMPFGWMGWGMSWLGHSILFNHAAYSTHSATVADWGFPHGGQRVFGGRSGLQGNIYHTPQPYGRYGNSNQFGRGGSYRDPRYGNAQAGRYNGYARGNGYTHPQVPGQQAYNRVPRQFARPPAANYAARPQDYGRSGEGYTRPGYGYGYANRPAQSYGARPGMAYASPYQGYRSPSYGQPAFREPVYRQPSYRAPEFNSSRAYAGRGNEAYGGPSARSERSGGFHLFGGGRQSRGFDGGHAPRSFSGGHFSGGGHAPRSFGHERAPKESHSSGHGHFR